MGPGDVIAERFVLDRPVGAGGMGTVWRATDRLDGSTVAVKLVDGTVQRAERFHREANVLADLAHPAIVRYVAHGQAGNGLLYLAMQWLEGEDLSQRLRRGALSISESTQLCRRIADALAYVHTRGVVHRDIKPANLFLPSGRLDRAVLVDFGIAHLGLQSARLTRTGMLIGTPGYMSPEQARGAKEIDSRTDVFALGAVFFECLTGRPPFVADQWMALLVKAVFEEAPRARSIRPELPPDLDGLIAQMLARDPDGRLRDGAAVLGALATCETVSDAAATTAPRPDESAPAVLTSDELRLLAVVLAAGTDGATVQEIGMAATVDDATAGPFEAMRRVAAKYGGEGTALADGSLAILLTGTGAATDLAFRAARAGLALHAGAPDMRIAIAMGVGVFSKGSAIGEVVDRSAALLARASEKKVRGVVLDDATTGLLDTGFATTSRNTLTLLVAEREWVDPRRTLLGRDVPCIGRDRELGSLLGLFDECREENAPRVALVTAPAGTGKSRVRAELLQRMVARGDDVTVWMVQGDAMRAGSPFGMIAPAIRRAADILDGESPRIRQRKLREYVTRNVGEARVPFVSEFVGELIGAVSANEESVQLRAARTDPVLMGDQMRRAFEELVDALTSVRPLVFVLENLHWGDPPSVQFIDSALRNLRERPLFVLATARPEVAQLFPDLWSGRGVTRFELAGLSKRSTERLVRHVLGDTVTAATIERVFAQSEGNAFFVEELLRAVAQGDADPKPASVMAMLQSRVEALNPHARAVLRAASVFGQTFWDNGVEALVGDEIDDTETQLRDLVDDEVLQLHGAARFAAHTEYAFRHLLLRDASYALLTDTDRAAGHRLAAEWLERAGEREASLVAQHFERAGEAARAVRWYRDAATQALEGNDYARAIEHAERAIACGADGASRGALRLLQAESNLYRGDMARMFDCAEQARADLASPSDDWFAAIGAIGASASRLGKIDRLEEVAAEMLAFARAEAPRPTIVESAARVAVAMYDAGRVDTAASLTMWLERLPAGTAETHPKPWSWAQRAFSRRAIHVGDPVGSIEHQRRAVAALERAGDTRSACVVYANIGAVEMDAGKLESAENALRSGLAMAERLGLRAAEALARQNLGWVLACKGDLDEALRVESNAAESFSAQRSLRMEGGARIYRSLIQSGLGRFDAAEHDAALACELLRAAPTLRPMAMAARAKAMLASGKVSEALAEARAAASGLAAISTEVPGAALIRCVLADAHITAGDRDAARSVITDGIAALANRARAFRDADARRSFVVDVPDNARTIQLARELDVAVPGELRHGS